MNNNGLGNLDDLFQSAQDDGLTDDTLGLVVANLNGPTMMQTTTIWRPWLVQPPPKIF
jgi:hypothetical protein